MYATPFSFSLSVAFSFVSCIQVHMLQLYGHFSSCYFFYTEDLGAQKMEYATQGHKAT